MDGGWAQFFRRYVALQLLGACCLSTGGVSVTLEGQPKLLFARLGNLLADGEGHLQAFDCKGAWALNPCLRDFSINDKARSTRAFSLLSLSAQPPAGSLSRAAQPQIV